MAKLVVILGPLAVGKMTVGQELEKITGLKLFHNHMTIELVAPYFSYGTAEGKRLVKLFRQEIFEAAARSDLYGLIFTYAMSFDHPSEWECLAQLESLFTLHGGEVSYVELEADFETRLERNKTPNRLLHKPTKRDVAWSEENMRYTEAKYRTTSRPGEVLWPRYLRVDTAHRPPEETAALIKETFDL